MPRALSKPTDIKRAEGNPGKRALNDAEPKYQRASLEPPPHLSGQARAVWVRFAGLLDRAGVLTEADASALEQLCAAHVEVASLRADLEENGRFQTVRTGSGDVMERVRPAYTALMDADRRLRAWLVEFGLTPAARAKVKADPARAEDPAEKYFN